MMAGELEVELVPQGTLIERIRAGGYGLGGILTQTGIGTPVENGKQRIEVDGKSYLLETALRADFALVQAFLADYLGNLSYALTARNFNPVIAMAADDRHRQRRQHRSGRRDLARPRRDAGACRRLPHRQSLRTRMEPQTIIARRIARELSPGMLVNLGIGIPTLVANYVPEGMQVFFQSENGLIGTGAPPEEGMAHPTLTDAGGRPVTALPGASTFDSAMSFGLIRGGHLDLTVLGGLQVDQAGQLANWMIPNKMVPGHGWRHGSGDRRQARHRGDAAHRQGRSEDREEMHAARSRRRAGGLVVTELAVIAFPTAAQRCWRPALAYPSPRSLRRPRPSSHSEPRSGNAL